MLEIGASFIGTETELILKSRRVVPGRLLEDGFSFQYPEWPAAARSCASEKRVLEGGSKDMRFPKVHGIIRRRLLELFADEALFPAGSVTFDCALLMRNIAHEWQAAAGMYVEALNRPSAETQVM